jgi:hypothetical protein
LFKFIDPADFKEKTLQIVSEGLVPHKGKMPAGPGWLLGKPVQRMRVVATKFNAYREGYEEHEEVL